jgi:hypothetical protein
VFTAQILLLTPGSRFRRAALMVADPLFGSPPIVRPPRLDDPAPYGSPCRWVLAFLPPLWKTYAP